MQASKGRNILSAADAGELRTKVLGIVMLFPARGGFGATGVPAKGE
jgi:hypothetical protein